METPSDVELIDKMQQIRERARREGKDRLPEPPKSAGEIIGEYRKVIEAAATPDDSSRVASELWEPACVACGASLGYSIRRGAYREGLTQCAKCIDGGVAERLRASGISFREIDRPLDALKNHDPHGNPYGPEYDRWLRFLRRFAAIKPGQRFDPPFAFAYGANGVGKTAGSERALRDAIRNGCAGRTIKFRDLLRKIMAAYGNDRDETAADVVGLYSSIHLLVIQEVGYEDHTEHNFGLFYDFVDSRWSAMLPTIFTSNFSPEQDSLGEALKGRTRSDQMVLAVIDRLRGGCGNRVFFLKGESWRGHEKDASK